MVKELARWGLLPKCSAQQLGALGECRGGVAPLPGATGVSLVFLFFSLPVLHRGSQGNGRRAVGNYAMLVVSEAFEARRHVGAASYDSCLNDRMDTK